MYFTLFSSVITLNNRQTYISIGIIINGIYQLHTKKKTDQNTKTNDNS